jgi:hypothetical protein
MKTKNYANELKNKTNFNDQEIELLINFLNDLAKIEFEQYSNKQKNEKSSSDVPSFKRRAS